MNEKLSNDMREFIGLTGNHDSKVAYEVISEENKGNYMQMRIRYSGYGGDMIRAFILIPKGTGPFPAVLIHHQHNGERFLGKSEVCGLIGDQYQAFGPILANCGVMVLAPDSICFEDRRVGYNDFGIEPNEEKDWLQHYNEMCYRLLAGETLMKKVLEDAAISISLLRLHPLVDPCRLGILGHSYGGNTVLFQGALDSRIKFGCSSGAAASFKNRIQNGTGIEMASTIPGFNQDYDIDDLVKCFAPRNLLLVSATNDKYSKDSENIYDKAIKEYEKMGATDALVHKRFEGEHRLDKERFEVIVDWIISQCK
ncbi:alpha/beta hydrolase family protein [Vallitalea okinawensis]|uniref:alpha/beta hydrolase family protein n=1 Tax=Vallitalea okinawensis TaxID=2078660 RepID=UPI000CFC52B4|nr:acetylxylan esterase [Vallitalea okinawensis]